MKTGVCLACGRIHDLSYCPLIVEHSETIKNNVQKKGNIFKRFIFHNPDVTVMVIVTLITTTIGTYMGGWQIGLYLLLACGIPTFMVYRIDKEERIRYNANNFD